MKIKFSPVLSNKKTKIIKIDENTLKIDGEIYIFDESLSVYDVDEIDIIRESYRVGNDLYIHIKYFFTIEEKEIWSNPNYYKEGGFRGSKFEDFSNLKNGSEIK